MAILADILVNPSLVLRLEDDHLNTRLLFLKVGRNLLAENEVFMVNLFINFGSLGSRVGFLGLVHQVAGHQAVEFQQVTGFLSPFQNMAGEGILIFLVGTLDGVEFGQSVADDA
jgi:hypothetical protein